MLSLHIPQHLIIESERILDHSFDREFSLHPTKPLSSHSFPLLSVAREIQNCFAQCVAISRWDEKSGHSLEHDSLRSSGSAGDAGLPVGHRLEIHQSE